MTKVEKTIAAAIASASAEEYLPDEFYLAGTGYHVVAPALKWEDLSNEDLAGIKAVTKAFDNQHCSL